MTAEEWAAIANAFGPSVIAIVIAILGVITQLVQAHWSTRRLKEQAREQVQSEIERRDWEREQQAATHRREMVEAQEQTRKEQLRTDSAELIAVAGEAKHALREVSAALVDLARRGAWGDMSIALGPFEDPDIPRRLTVAVAKMKIYGKPIRDAADTLEWNILFEYNYIRREFQERRTLTDPSSSDVPHSYHSHKDLAALTDQIAHELWGHGMPDAARDQDGLTPAIPES